MAKVIKEGCLLMRISLGKAYLVTDNVRNESPASFIPWKLSDGRQIVIT